MTIEIMYDLKAEQATLGSLMLDPDMTPAIAEKLAPEDFGVARASELYRVMLSLFDQQMPYDTWLLLDEAKKQGLDLDASFIIECLNTSNSAYYAEHYAATVKRWSDKRQQLAIANEFSQRVYSGEDPEATAAWLQSVSKGGQQKDDSQMSLAESLVRADVLIEGWENPENLAELERWSWAWGTWNTKILPPPKGIITLISAAEGTGKTIAGEVQAEDWAKKGNNIVFFHFELNRDVMVTRRLSRLSGISYRKLVTNNLSPAERKLRDAVKAEIQSWPGNIEYVACAGWDIDRVVYKLRALQAQGLADAFVLDYFQKLQISPRQARLRMDEVRFQRDSIEQLAIWTNEEDAGGRGVVLSQLNKGGKQKSFESVSGVDLMGTAALGEKANVSAIIHKEVLMGGKLGAQGRVLVEPGGLDTKASVKLVKNTLGPTGAWEQYTNGCFNLSDDEES